MNIQKHTTTVPQEDYEEMIKAFYQPNTLANASSLFFAFMIDREVNIAHTTWSPSTSDPDKRKLAMMLIEEFKDFCTRAGWTIVLDTENGMVVITELKKTEI